MTGSEYKQGANYPDKAWAFFLSKEEPFYRKLVIETYMFHTTQRAKVDVFLDVQWANEVFSPSLKIARGEGCDGDPNHSRQSTNAPLVTQTLFQYT